MNPNVVKRKALMISLIKDTDVVCVCCRNHYLECLSFFQVATVINKYDTMVEYLHFSDQYAGPRQPE